MTKVRGGGGGGETEKEEGEGTQAQCWLTWMGSSTRGSYNSSVFPKPCSRRSRSPQRSHSTACTPTAESEEEAAAAAIMADRFGLRELPPAPTKPGQWVTHLKKKRKQLPRHQGHPSRENQSRHGTRCSHR